MPYDPQEGRPLGRAVALERGDGVAELVFGPPGPGSGLVHLYQTDPCRVLFPRPVPGDPTLAVLVTTSGGLAGGDRIRLSIAARDGACATVTTQAAEKVYRSLGRSLGDDCHIEASIEVGRGGWLDWLPQEAILFDGARLRRRTEIDVAPGGKFLGCEMLAFGRAARGECFTNGFLLDAWRVSRGGKLAWVDTLRLDGDIASALTGRYSFAGANAIASAIYVGDDAAAHLETAREFLEASSSRAGATVVNGVLLARFLGDAGQVRRDLVTYLAGMRRAAGGWRAELPRGWYH